MTRIALGIALVVAVGCEEESMEWDGYNESYVMEEEGYRQNQMEGMDVTVTITKADHFDYSNSSGPNFGTEVKYEVGGVVKKLTLVGSCHEDAMFITAALPGTTVPAPGLVDCNLTCKSYTADRKCEECDIDCSDEVTGG